MERLELPGITLEGYAEGGIRTSIGVPEANAMFDAGTCIPTCVRYDNIFITHGHPDHIGSITNIIARRDLQGSGKGKAQVYVPPPVKSPLEDVFEAWWKINGAVGPKFPVNIIGYKIGSDPVQTKKDTFVRSVKTYHRIASQGYVLSRVTRKLKEKFIGAPREDIINAKKSGEEITENKHSDLLCVPGDTTIDFLIKTPEAQNSKVLVHEVTVWSDDVSSVEKTKRYGHTHFREMIEHCDKFNGDFLVLCHRSMKHSRTEIEKIVETQFPSEMRGKIRIFDGGRKR
jgi:ribonuclease Z